MSEALEQKLRQGLAVASAGHGPLLQRDYWLVIRNSQRPPSGVVRLVRERFAEFAPAQLAKFTRQSSEGRREEKLEIGDEMEVRIRGAGRAHVRMVHESRTSFTLATLIGHPEAGRITFGAYRNALGDVLFHIRSRARFGSTWHSKAFSFGGDAMQTDMWAEFLNRVALTCGEGAVGYCHAETTRLASRREHEDPCAPTYLARGD